MSITILEYFKIILEKVSFDAKLFEKELRKAISQLIKSELIILKKWCYQQFGKKYKNILKNVFSTITFRKKKLVEPALISK
jgi:hypothetical protein